jgi:hypothetical protein
LFTAFIGQIDSSNRAPRPTFPDGTLKPLIWTGDLNVCHKDIDVTHPRFFATQKPEGRKGKPPEPPPSDPNDFGQPGEFIFGYFWLFLVIFIWAILLTSCFVYRFHAQ